MNKKTKRENILADGFSFKRPHVKAPDFIKGSVGVNVENAIAFMQKHKNERGYINLDLKVSKEGNPYFALNDYKNDANQRRAVTI